jgi:hypothetical protein
MLHLPRMLAKLRTSLLLRLILLALSATLLLVPLIGAGILLTTRPVSLRGLEARVAVSPQGQAGSLSPSLQPPRQAGCQGQGCFNQDPIMKGCIADAITQASTPIIYNGSAGVLQIQVVPPITVRPGEIIGRLDRRYSPLCQSYWARAFSFGSTDAVEMTLTYGPNLNLDAQSFSTSPEPLALYSNMTQEPQLATAIIELVDDTSREFRVTATLG